MSETPTPHSSDYATRQITPLGQTQEIIDHLRKIEKDRLIRFRDRVDAFTGQHPKSKLLARKFIEGTKENTQFLRTLTNDDPISNPVLRDLSPDVKNTSAVGVSSKENCLRPNT